MEQGHKAPFSSSSLNKVYCIGESIHAKFKATYSRYKRDEEHKEDGEKLKKAVVNFGARRIS